MSKTTRIHRKTYATPQRDKRPLRFIHVSTRYAWMPDNPRVVFGPQSFRKALLGVTFVRDGRPG